MSMEFILVSILLNAQRRIHTCILWFIYKWLSSHKYISMQHKWIPSYVMLKLIRLKNIHKHISDPHTAIFSYIYIQTVTFEFTAFNLWTSLHSCVNLYSCILSCSSVIEKKKEKCYTDLTVKGPNIVNASVRIRVRKATHRYASAAIMRPYNTFPFFFLLPKSNSKCAEKMLYSCRGKVPLVGRQSCDWLKTRKTSDWL